MAWNELKATLDENKQLMLEESERPIVACPVCGHAPLDQNEQGVLNCPLGHWRSDQV